MKFDIIIQTMMSLTNIPPEIQFNIIRGLDAYGLINLTRTCSCFRDIFGEEFSKLISGYNSWATHVFRFMDEYDDSTIAPIYYYLWSVGSIDLISEFMKLTGINPSNSPNICEEPWLEMRCATMRTDIQVVNLL